MFFFAMSSKNYKLLIETFHRLLKMTASNVIFEHSLFIETPENIEKLLLDINLFYSSVCDGDPMASNFLLFLNNLLLEFQLKNSCAYRSENWVHFFDDLHHTEIIKAVQSMQ